jgi:hypothetical protein
MRFRSAAHSASVPLTRRRITSSALSIASVGIGSLALLISIVALLHDCATMQLILLQKCSNAILPIEIDKLRQNLNCRRISQNFSEQVSRHHLRETTGVSM